MSLLLSLLLAAVPPTCPEGAVENPGGTALAALSLEKDSWLLVCGAKPEPDGRVYALSVWKAAGEKTTQLYAEPTLWFDGYAVNEADKSVRVQRFRTEVVVTAGGASEGCGAQRSDAPDALTKAVLAKKTAREPRGQDRTDDAVTALFEAALRGHAGAAAVIDRWNVGPPGEGELTEWVTQLQGALAQLRKLACKPYGVALPARVK